MKGFLYLSLLFLPALVIAQKKITTFQHTFEGFGMNGGLYMNTTPDSCFAVCGQHASSGAGGCDIYVYKRDKCGIIKFYKTYGGTENEGGSCLQPTSDGGMIVSGFGTSFPNPAGPGSGTGSYYHAHLLKLNKAGNAQWFRVYGTWSSRDDRFNCVYPTSDGGYIAAGDHGVGLSTVNIPTQGWIVKTDAAGAIQWANTYAPSDNGYSRFKYIEQTSDGGYIAIGKLSLVSDVSNYYLMLMKLSSTGTVQWCKYYNTTSKNGETDEEDDFGVSGQITPDGGYIATVTSNNFGAGSDDVVVAKFDSNGNLQWGKSYGGSAKDQPRCIHTTKDGGYIVSGYTMSFGHGEQDSYLLRIDNTGKLLWSWAYGGAKREKAEGVREFYDGGFVADGHTNSFAASAAYVFDVYSLKTDSLGRTGCNEIAAGTIVFPAALTATNATMNVISEGSSATQPIIEKDYIPTPVILCEQNMALDPGFYFDNACNGLPVQFHDTSTSTNGTLNSWLWDFGDASATSTVQNPVHQYSATGTYTVSLTISSSDACAPMTIKKTITISQGLTADFVTSPVCQNSNSIFTDQSAAIAPATVSSWDWNFGDPSGISNTSVQQSPTHAYSNAGTYTVTLIATSSDGCKDTVKLPAQVNPGPTATFTAVNVCMGSPVDFTNQSTIPGGATASWNWDFGDGNSSSQQNPSNSYTATGTYTVTLIAQAGTCSDTVKVPVTVNPPPVADFTPKNVCFNNPIPFADQSTGATQWQWNFGDGNTSSLQNPSYTYAAAGNYTVTLAASNGFGCKDSIKQKVIINPLPAANFSAPVVCLKDTTCFSDLSTIATGTVTGWSWNFDDPATGNSNISNLQNPCHVFNGLGPYNVLLTVTSDSGCQSIKTLATTVAPLPNAAFVSPNVCMHSPSVFTNGSVSSDPKDPINAWHWDFGDGSSLINTISPVHTYTAAGTYSVALIVTTQLGCKDTVVNPLTVHNPPIANLSGGGAGCDHVCNQYVDLSTASDGTINSWSWSFPGGSPSSSSMQNPSNICYNKPGAYGASLIVTTTLGCRDTIKAPALVTIYNSPKADFCIDQDKAPATDPVFTFCPQWSPFLDVTSWTWDFGDGSPLDSMNTNPVHSYSAVATANDFYSYDICLKVKNQFGCPDSICKTVELIPEFTFYIPNTFTPNGDQSNQMFFGKGRGIKDYNIWVFDRWGNMIWDCHYTGKNTDWDNPGQDGMPSVCQWDGVVVPGGVDMNGRSNELAQEDVYVWKVALTDIFEKRHNYIGQVNIVK